MDKKKKVSLDKYLNDLTNRLAAPIPEKHKGHEASYKAFLNRELAQVKAALDKAKQA